MMEQYLVKKDDDKITFLKIKEKKLVYNWVYVCSLFIYIVEEFVAVLFENIRLYWS